MMDNSLVNALYNFKIRAILIHALINGGERNMFTTHEKWLESDITAVIKILCPTDNPSKEIHKQWAIFNGKNVMYKKVLK